MVSKRSPRPALSSSRSKRSVEREKVVQKPPYGASNTSTMPVKPLLREQRPVEPALRRAPGMHALDHGAVLRGHQAGRLRAGDAERVHGLLGVEAERARRAGGGREHADGRARVPALADVLLAHAHADARTDLVAGDRGGQELAARAAAHGSRRPRASAGSVTAPTCSTPCRCTSSSSKPCTWVPLTSAACGEDRRSGCPRPRGARRVEPRQRALQDRAPGLAGAEDARSRANRGSAA